MEEASVVFLRAANVGGHRTFRPAELARSLAHLAVTNQGAAGTFVVGAPLPEAALREAFAAALPFVPELAVIPARTVLGWLTQDPFGAVPEGTKRFVSVLLSPPPSRPALPLDRPEGLGWEVRLVDVSPAAAFTLQRGAPPHKLYPNEVVERALGVPATTRGWSTIEALGRLLTRSA